jgi:hypothetical protein
VTRPAEVLMQEIEGESVLVNLDKDQYYGLDNVGTRLYQLLTNSPSVGVALDLALAEYAVDAATLERDVLDLLERLAAAGLAEVTDARPAS